MRFARFANGSWESPWGGLRAVEGGGSTGQLPRKSGRCFGGISEGKAKVVQRGQSELHRGKAEVT